MTKLVKKCKTIYTALGKGTWKGHTYDYGKFNQPSITVHQKNKNYNKRDKIISPDFEITYNPGFLKIFDEIVTNSVDESKREGSKLNTIKVTIGGFEIRFKALPQSKP